MTIKHSPKGILLPQGSQVSQYTQDNQYQQGTPTSSNSQINKRKPEEEIERSNDEVMNYMKNMNATISNDIKGVKNEVASITSQINDLKADLISQLNHKYNELNGEISSMKRKLEVTDSKTDKNNKIALQNQKLINVMQQEKMINKMEICGTAIDKNIKADVLKAEVIKVIQSFKVNVKEEEIKYATIKNVNTKDKAGVQHEKSIISVEFDSLLTKVRVMLEKRQSKIHNNVFFDHALTARNRYLMSLTRKVAKDGNFTVMVKNNKVCIKKNEKMIKFIESEDDLNEPKTWEPNASKKSTTNMSNA